jgi:predicted DNA-binding protein
MSTVYSIRLPKKLKEQIDNMSEVDWQSETRAFLEQRVRRERIKKQLEEAREIRERMKVSLNLAELIREDRENVH